MKITYEQLESIKETMEEAKIIINKKLGESMAIQQINMDPEYNEFIRQDIQNCKILIIELDKHIEIIKKELKDLDMEE